MAVYVDNMRARVGRMVFCHMVADTPEELHAMADEIGLLRKWYQKNASTPHYDVTLGKRKLAVDAGAIEVDMRTLAKKIREINAAAMEDPQRWGLL